MDASYKKYIHQKSDFLDRVALFSPVDKEQKAPSQMPFATVSTIVS
jgi:hypothetical protein